MVQIHRVVIERNSICLQLFVSIKNMHPLRKKVEFESKLSEMYAKVDGTPYSTNVTIIQALHL